MDKSNMKNMVVLKDLPSNIVEEAIVVLKSNRKINKIIQSKNKKTEKTVQIKNKEDKQYIVKEAEMIISNYINEIENPKITNKGQKNLQKKYNRLKRINRYLAFFAFFSFIAYLIK